MPLPARIAIIASLLLAGPTQAGEKPSQFINPERYRCVATTKTDLGETSARYELDGDGNLVSFFGSWWPLPPRYPGDARMQAGWRLSPTEPGKIMGGWFSGKVAVGTRDEPRIAKSAKFRMEITTHLDDGPLNWPQRGFASDFHKWRDYATSSLGVTADWDDLYAMAKGSGQLFIIARDKKGTILGSHRIEYDLLRQVHDEVVRLSQESAAMAADYRAKCEHEEANNIIVT